MSRMVKIKPEYVQQRSLLSDIGLVIRGPYEHVMKLTEKLESIKTVLNLRVRMLA